MTRTFAVIGSTTYELAVPDEPGQVDDLLLGMGAATVPLVDGGSLTWVRGASCPVVILRRP